MCPLVPERIFKLKIVILEAEPLFEIAVFIFQFRRFPLQAHERVVYVHELLLRFDFRRALSNLIDRFSSGRNGVEECQSC
jgi:hypothetical protein